MRQPPPEIKRGPKILRAWLNQLRAFAVQTRPLESELCDLEEKLDGTQILPRPRATDTAPTFTHTLAGTETLLAWGAGYLTIEIEDTGLPDGTPVAVNTEGLDFPVQFAGPVVDGGTIRLYYQMAADEPPVTMPAGTITVRPIL